jgi:tetratricopeptide (TPR) repeat protein
MVISRMMELREQIDALARAADHAQRNRQWDDAVTALRAMLAHPCAHHLLIEHEVLDELHQALRSAGRHDEAIDAKRAAIAAGYRSRPDPEADIAETLLEAGRRVEADRLYAELRQRDPDDVWLYNSAGFSYAGVDDREALRWCLDGIAVAIETGDPDRVVTQLLEMAERQWSALGEPVDESVVERVEAFTASWTPVPTPRWGDLPSAPVRRRCEHCGFDPEGPPPTIATATRRVEHAGRPAPLALAWFPPDEWAAARERWPDLADLPEDHTTYSHRIESHAKAIAKHLPGRGIHIAPLHVEDLITVAGERADTAAARSERAAQVLQRGSAMAWPPARNDRCWCGSGRKYKQCCGPVAAAPVEDGADEEAPGDRRAAPRPDGRNRG